MQPSDKPYQLNLATMSDTGIPPGIIGRFAVLSNSFLAETQSTRNSLDIPNESLPVHASDIKFMSSALKLEDRTSIINTLTNRPLYVPHGEWAWVDGYNIISQDPGVLLGGTSLSLCRTPKILTLCH